MFHPSFFVFFSPWKFKPNQTWLSFKWLGGGSPPFPPKSQVLPWKLESHLTCWFLSWFLQKKNGQKTFSLKTMPQKSFCPKKMLPKIFYVKYYQGKKSTQQRIWPKKWRREGEIFTSITRSLEPKWPWEQFIKKSWTSSSYSFLSPTAWKRTSTAKRRPPDIGACLNSEVVEEDVEHRFPHSSNCKADPRGRLAGGLHSTPNVAEGESLIWNQGPRGRIQRRIPTHPGRCGASEPPWPVASW